MTPRLIAASLAFGALAAPAVRAQEAKPACPATPAALPAELAGWSAHKPVTAATDPAALAGATVAVGTGVDAALKPTADVRYLVPGQKTGATPSYGGMVQFDVAQAGTYRVAQSSGAWVDVFRGTEVVKSTAHSHGPDCSQIRKMVDFPLTPGRYTLQIEDSATQILSLLIARLP